MPDAPALLPVTPGHGVNVKVIDRDGVLIPVHIIDSVKSEGQFLTDTIEFATPNELGPLSETSVPISQVFVRAALDNTDEVYLVADPNEPTKHYPLTAGEVIPVVIDNLNKVYAYAGVAGQKVHYAASGPESS